MKKIVQISAALSLAASALLAETVLAVKVDTDLSGFKCKDEAVKLAKFTEVALYPQTTIKLNDKKANELNSANKAKRVQVAALYDGKNIALILRWPDKTRTVQQGYKSDVYGDGFAVQFATKFDEPEKLPYIGMGSDGRPVVIYLQKAVAKVYEPNADGVVGYQVNPHNTNRFGEDLEKFEKRVEQLAIRDYQKAFVSEGFRSMTEIKDKSAKYSADMHYVDAKKMWGGAVVRPLKDEYANLDKGAIPVALAVWDGEKLQRDGQKYLSGWIAVKLVGKTGGNRLAEVVNEKAKGDVAKGKELSMQNCASCHKFPGSSAPEYMAPDLSNIGGQATAAYIRESIVDPNAVVVPGYNRNSHPNFQWYMTDDKGNRTSTMPPFDYLDKQSIEDIVAFMQTLKAEVEK
ncbi:ethylbenzene dehydrogenase-related protein [Nitrosophilus alvini]|uniref:ethylbenzene dehydrogenase-related protein n=1 Tax=Nitrosophilus alvini TaxID=2714855 RepID=UPI00190DBE20|nr:ethylbenzene dehydrogenase-related protein [Nitrosophilus alvini]